jgi:S-DNA-T family DNA segregation ATPase FtsK/SpoIIIE
LSTLRAEQIRTVSGGFVLLVALFLLIAFVWHLFFTGVTDQSVVELHGPADGAGAHNPAGQLGASLANLFITQGFGVLMLTLPFYVAWLGWAVLDPAKFRSFLLWLPYWSGALIWGSTLFGFIDLAFGLKNPDLAGAVGMSMNEWLGWFIGLFGVALVLVFTASAFVIFQFNPRFRALPPLPPLPFSIRPLWDAVLAWRLPAFSGLGVSGKNNRDDDPATKTPPVAEPTVVAQGAAFTEPELNPPGFEVKLRRPAQPKGTGSGATPFYINNQPADEVLVAEFPPVAGSAAQPARPVPVTDPPLEIEIAPFSSEDQPLLEDFTNIVAKEPNLFVKDIPDEDQEIAGAHEAVGDWEVYDPTKDLSQYQYPTLDLLRSYENPNGISVNREELEANKGRILAVLRDFGIEITQIKATVGPTVTLYEIVPAAGIRINKIKNLEDDIALNLAALGIRIIAPMPGKGTIGIEIPNASPEVVSLRNVLATEKFRNTPMALPIALGRTISNEVFIADLAKMPHLLVAGATGQGKSVGLNCIIASLLYKKHPSQIKFVLIDPKKVEMTLYQSLEKHFLAKLPNYEDAIITDNKQVIHVLNSLCLEMDNRYQLLKEARVRALGEYNEKFVNRRLNPLKGHKYLPYIVLIIDELADLMMTAGKEIETPIARLAQLARAVGIHLVVATQRPSVNVITGTIKANFPVRLSYRVISKTDSRTILDTNGADQLIGRGDMLVNTGSELIRIQNAFIDTPEVEQLVQWIERQQGYAEPFYLPEIQDDTDTEKLGTPSKADLDSKFEEAARLIVENQLGSTSLIQRRMNLGYARAGRLMDQLEIAGIVGPNNGSKPREVYVHDLAELERILRTL